jgi:DNA-binding transcriptional MerR regulator
LDKAPDAFRTISEVAADLDLPQHVLRFWESRFPQIRPMKRAGGRRYYRPDDVDLLRGIRHLLYGEGYTIRGVQRILREQGPKFVQAVWQPGAAQPGPPTGDDQALDEAGQLAPDQIAPDMAARNVFGMPKSSFPQVGPEVPGPPLANVGIAPVVQPGLRSDEVRKLQAALEELSECRRMVDAALRSDAA